MKVIKKKESFIESKLLAKDWINKKFIEQIPLKEAFGSGKASMVVQKLGNILGRKIGEKVIFSEVPMMYENDYGAFAGYLGSVSNGRFYLKINFKLTASDSIYSVDFYKLDFSPSYTVDMEGLNIVQIVNAIIEELIEDNEIDDSIMEGTILKPIYNKSYLLERGNASDIGSNIYIIETWVEEKSKVLKELQDKPLPEVFSNLFLPWVKDKPRYKEIFKYYFFVKVVKAFLLSRGLTNKTFRIRKKGSRERQIEDPILASQFDEIIDTISWEEKFEFLKGNIALMKNGRLHSLYIYGDPGSGKSHEILNTLKELNVDYKLYKGGVKNTDGLIRILYNNREDKILVFDDFDSALKKDPNIWKAILQNDTVRELTYVDVGSNRNMADIPPKFEFTSSVIFISNYNKIDSAIASRSIVLEISLSNEEMTQKIEKTLENFRPEIDMNKKKKALDYAKEIAPGVQSIDYRVLDNILIAMDVSPNNWKKMVLLLLKSIN